MRRLVPLLTLVVLLAGCGFQEPPLEPITYEVLSRVEIPPISGRTGSWDAMVVDPATQTLYVTDGTDPAHQGVDVIDIHSSPGRYVNFISTGDVVPNGLALAPDVHKLYTGNDDGTVSVIDVDPTAKTYQTIIGSVNVGARLGADDLGYDPVNHEMYVDDPGDGVLVAIDSRVDRIAHRITGLGTMDEPMYDPADGMLYVGAPDLNQLIKIDPSTDTVVHKYSFDVVCAPHGLAVNPKTNQGLIACSDKDEPIVIAWDFTTERVIRTFDLAGGSDLALYDAETNHFVVASASFAPAEMAVFSGSPIQFMTAVRTSHKSRGLAYDDVHRTIYTYDTRLREAGLWAFPDPLSQCDATLTHCRRPQPPGPGWEQTDGAPPPPVHHTSAPTPAA